MIDILTGVNRPREPVRFLALAVPCIAVSVPVRDGPGSSGIRFNRFGQCLKRNAVFFHAAMYPHDEALPCVPIEVERALFLSLFHNVPMSLRQLRAF